MGSMGSRWAHNGLKVQLVGSIDSTKNMNESLLIKYKYSNLYSKAEKMYLQFVGRKKVRVATCLPISMTRICIGLIK